MMISARSRVSNSSTDQRDCSTSHPLERSDEDEEEDEEERVHPASLSLSAWHHTAELKHSTENVGASLLSPLFQRVVLCATTPAGSSHSRALRSFTRSPVIYALFESFTRSPVIHALSGHSRALRIIHALSGRSRAHRSFVLVIMTEL